MGTIAASRLHVARVHVALIATFAMVVIGLVAPGPTEAGAAASSSPSVTITPAPTGGRFSDGQAVRVSVGPNSLFVPLSRVVILECADPGGDPAHLPLSLATCDENTIQGDTTVVQADGSFVEKSYDLYALPSKVLGEQGNWQPVCNPKSECVLFVGENQNDFSKPKVFSHPFSMSSASVTVSTGTVPATVGTSAVAPVVTPAVSAAVSLTPATLAYTGPSTWLLAMFGAGIVLMLLGMFGVLIVRRSGR